MRKTVFVLTLILGCSALAQMPAKPEAQIAAMKKLDYMIGNWEGGGWIDMGARREFRGSEIIQRKLEGTALLVEGAHFAGDVPIHTTLGVISFNPKSQKYEFDTWLATGSKGDNELILIDKGWYWEIKPPGAGTIRFTTTFADGDWFEIGERSTDGTSWKKFFEMRLKKK